MNQPLDYEYELDVEFKLMPDPEMVELPPSPTVLDQIEVGDFVSKAVFPDFLALLRSTKRRQMSRKALTGLHMRAVKDLLLATGFHELQTRKDARTADFIHHDLKVIVELKTKSEAGRSMQKALNDISPQIFQRLGVGSFRLAEFPFELKRLLASRFANRYMEYMTDADEQIRQTKSIPGLEHYSGCLLIVNASDVSIELSPLMHLLLAAFSRKKDEGELQHVDAMVYQIQDIWITDGERRIPGLAIPFADGGKGEVAMSVMRSIQKAPALCRKRM